MQHNATLRDATVRTTFQGPRSRSSLASYAGLLHSRRLQPLHLIDAIGPFFRGHDVRTINWSKIPWQNLPKTAMPRQKPGGLVRADLTKFADQASAWGFNAVSLDDVTHLADHAWLEPELRERIALLPRGIHPCFAILHGTRPGGASDDGCDDLHAELRRRMTEAKRSVKDLPRRIARFGFFTAFRRWRNHCRIGEADGKGVHDEFRSELTVKTPSQARQMTYSNHCCRCLSDTQRTLVFPHLDGRRVSHRRFDVASWHL
jgi:hypothetical protein